MLHFTCLSKQARTCMAGNARSAPCSKGVTHAAGVDREAYYEEAIKLGGGVEALLGFVEGACKRAAPSAAAYVAARRHNSLPLTTWR